MSAGGDEQREAELERLRAALYAPDAPPEAAERYRAAVARAAPETGEGAEPEPDAAAVPTGPPEVAVAAPPGHRRRTALAAGAVLLAAGAAAVLLAPRPPAVVPDEPTRVGPAIWSAHGVNGASSPELRGGGGPLLVRLRCQGEGRILLAVDSRVRTLECVAGRTVEDAQYFGGTHGDFMLSLSLVGHPAWSASVHRVQVSG